MALSKQYGVFVVRIWHEPAGEDESVWRASALNTVTKERTYFAAEQELVAFLGLSQPDEEGLFRDGELRARTRDNMRR
jgi:hypothetical protein